MFFFFVVKMVVTVPGEGGMLYNTQEYAYPNVILLSFQTEVLNTTEIHNYLYVGYRSASCHMGKAAFPNLP